MKIAVLGTGMAGRTLASRLAGLGHDVVIGSRDVATLECPVAASGGGLARPRSPASLAFPVQHRDRPCIVDGGGCMAAWRKAELERIAGADDLHIAPFRDDGMTYGMPTWIRSVVAEHALYVRAYKGQASRWYGAALRQKAGRIVVAGMTTDVTFEPVDGRSTTASTTPTVGSTAVAST
jgi:hypothetical protein